MTEAFNPYREWLGLDVHNPNHYQLLDLPAFEEDSVQIHAAADRALARVRSHRPGARAAAWAQLLDNLTQAKICLTHPAQKSAYDETLRHRAAQPPTVGNSPENADSRQADLPVEELGSDPEPVIALVNQSPDLFPPGMAPTKPAEARSDKKDQRVAAHRATARDRQAEATAAKPPAPKKKPPLPPATSIPDDSAGKEQADLSSGSQSSGDLVPQPVPPAPMNAHVAPPRRAQPSPLPIVIGIAAVLIVVTLIVMLLAMRDESGSVSGALRPAREPVTAPSATPLARTDPSSPAGIDSRRSNPMGDPLPVPTDPKPPVVDQQAPPTTAAHPPPAPETSPLDPQSSAPPRESIPPPTPPTTIAESKPSSTPTPEPPSPRPDELRSLAAALDAARQALAQQQFQRARSELATAESSAQLPQHLAMVRRLRHLADKDEAFWKVVANVVQALNGAEELTFGDGDMVAIVVETGPHSITVRSQGRNRKYSFTDMPPGLALAIAKQQLQGDNPEDLVLLGACLASTPERKPVHLDEARRYWTLAQMAGADVDDLLLTLTDSYELTP